MSSRLGNVCDLLAVSAEKRPQHGALVFAGEVWSYSKLHAAACRFARALSSLEALGELLGADIQEARPMQGGDATYLGLADGRRLVLKGIPRQSLESWEPGKPWAELVALDMLSDAGAPVPPLVAADVQHGWLVQGYVDGVRLDHAFDDRKAGKAFRALVTDFRRLQQAFVSLPLSLREFATDPPDEVPALAEGLGGLLDGPARKAWSDLTREIVPAERETGPLDVRAANAILGPGGGVSFLDLATFGPDYAEKRLVAYAHSVGPPLRSLLNERAFDYYLGERGSKATLRLVFFDFLYLGLVISRLIVASKRPETPAAHRIIEAWGSTQGLWEEALRMWSRPRVDDERVRRISRGMDRLKEHHHR